jgi:peptidoglycan hydrolase CwlO-like protein
MEIKWEELSNAEILREQLNLKNTFDKLKSDIMKMVNQLDDLNAEFLKSEKELEKRNIKL